MSFVRKFKRGGKTYLAEVENQWVKGKVVQRFIRYVGKEADGRTILSTSVSDIRVDEVKLYGPLLILHHLAEEIGLRQHLGSYAAEVVSMVYAHCLDYKSVNKMESWFERTDLNMMLNIEGLTESRLLSAMDFLEQADHEKLQRDIFTSVKQHYDLGDSGIIYDVTNTYLYGKKCSLGKLGHDKEGVKGRPLIQIGLGVTKDEGIAVLHKTFDGNIHDSRTLQDVITDFRHYGLKPGIIVYDRGITSGQNIADIKALKWDTVCGVALTDPLKKFWRPVIQSSNRLRLKDRVQLNKTIFYVVTRQYSIGNVKGELHLCFNPQQQLDLRDSRRTDILYAQKLLRDGKTIAVDLEKYFDKRGNVITKVLDAAEEFDGYSCIFTTRKMQKAPLVHCYFDKDLVEKAFRSLKGVVKLQPIRHWLSQRVVAHVFICYLAFLLLSLLRHRLKKIQMSSEEALHELKSMYKVYLKNKKNTLVLSRVVTLTKKQEKILKTVSRSLLAKTA
jgi:transposase